MFEGLYENLSKKPIRRENLLPQKSGFDALLAREGSISEKKVLEAFITELRSLLELNSALRLIEEINELEAKLRRFTERDLDIEVPSLDDFYKELSPLLLQKFWERRKNTLIEESLDALFLETIHIALEEEIYIWQEKIQ